MATQEPPPSTGHATDMGDGVYTRISLPFHHALGASFGFRSTPFGDAGMSWRKYQDNTPPEMAVPTLDVGLNPVMSSVFDLNAAGELVSVVLVMYWAYLKEHAVHNWEELKDQQQEWVDFDLTEPDLTYLSKHNLAFTDQVDVSLSNSLALKMLTGNMMDNGKTNTGFMRFVQASIPAIHTTELIRVMVHCGTTNLANHDWVKLIQRSMERVKEQAQENPTACRVEFLFKGQSSSQADLGALLLGQGSGGVTQDNWQIYSGSDWTVRFVETKWCDRKAKFATLNSRLGLRFEASE